MHKIFQIITMLILVATSTSCIRDGLIECPGNVRLLFYAEQFQNSSNDPLAATESVFTNRVKHLRYYLYCEGELYDQGILEKLPESTAPDYIYAMEKADYGNYEMVVIANCSKTALTGNPANPANLVLTFPGCADTEDYFTAVYPFTVNSDELVTHTVGLLRTQGLIIYRFVNMPAEISDVDILIENVSNQKWIKGDYMQTGSANSRYAIVPLTQSPRKRINSLAGEERYVMGTFPTLTNEKATYHLGLYRNGEPEPFRRQMITDTLTVRRNQLLEVIATFDTDYNVDFEINLNPDWDGSTIGGETEID